MTKPPEPPLIAMLRPTCLMVRTIRMRSFKYDTENSALAPDALTLLMSGLASVKPDEYGSNSTISTPSPGACSRRPFEVEVPNAVFSKMTATFGLSLTSLDICNCACANCEARQNGVNV